MRKRWALAGAAVLVAVAATGGVVAMSSAKPATGAAQEPPVNTAKVEKGRLSDMVSQYGILTYRARSDGSPFSVVNQARGVYTELPEAGDQVDCGDVLYRVDDKPVLLLCGSTPAYRSLSQGDSGPDVSELNANLVHLGPPIVSSAKPTITADRWSWWARDWVVRPALVHLWGFAYRAATSMAAELRRTRWRPVTRSPNTIGGDPDTRRSCTPGPGRSGGRRPARTGRVVQFVLSCATAAAATAQPHPARWRVWVGPSAVAACALMKKSSSPPAT
jgi:hypothetical protein